MSRTQVKYGSNMGPFIVQTWVKHGNIYWEEHIGHKLGLDQPRHIKGEQMHVTHRRGGGSTSLARQTSLITYLHWTDLHTIIGHSHQHCMPTD